MRSKITLLLFFPLSLICVLLCPALLLWYGSYYVATGRTINFNGAGTTSVSVNIGDEIPITIGDRTFTNPPLSSSSYVFIRAFSALDPVSVVLAYASYYGMAELLGC